MTEVSGMTPGEGDVLGAVDAQLIKALAVRARAGGLQLSGAGGLLSWLTKTVLESALEGARRSPRLGQA